MLLCELRIVQMASGLTLSIAGVFKEVLGAELTTVYDVCHNIAKSNLKPQRLASQGRDAEQNA